MKMFVRLSSLVNGRIGIWSLGFQELLQRCEKTRMEVEGTFLLPCGVFEFSVCECPGPQIQEVTTASSPFLVPVQACNEQARMGASLDVPLGSVLCKPGLKRVGAKFRVKAGLVGPLSTSQDMTQPYFFR